MNDEERKTQTKRLRELREALGYAEQKRWAEATGLTATQWGNMETGRNRVSLDAANKIKDKFPFLTKDYIQDGETRGLSLDTLRMLGLAPPGSSASGC